MRLECVKNNGSLSYIHIPVHIIFAERENSIETTVFSIVRMKNSLDILY